MPMHAHAGRSVRHPFSPPKQEGERTLQGHPLQQGPAVVAGVL